jgi:SAM-dependent methyltransferase
MSLSFHCVVCEAREGDTLFDAGGFDDPKERFQLRQCRGCGVVSTSWGDGELDLGSYYSSDYYGGEGAKFIAPVEYLTWLGNRARAKAIFARMDRPATPDAGGLRVLDIGCGRGHFLGFMSQQGWECHGLEREDFRGKVPAGVKLHLASAEVIPLDSGYFDVISIWHVLEHLPNPLATLKEARRLLRPGGVLALAVPNFGGWQAGWFGAHWPHLDLPRHLYHFSPETLAMTLSRADLYSFSRGRGSFEQDLFGFIQGLMNRAGLPANGLFHQIKGGPEVSRAALPLWAVAAGVLSPLAILESTAARLAGKSATLICYARPAE